MTTNIQSGNFHTLIRTGMCLHT